MTRIAGYHSLTVVRQGILGVTYRGAVESTGQIVAVQVFRLSSISRSTQLTALRAQIDVLRQFAMAGTPEVLGGDELPDGRFYIARNWIQGNPLNLRDLPATSALLRLLEQLVSIVEAAHRHGCYHLHIRPSQIVVGTGRRPRCALLGLGIAGILGMPELQPSTEAVRYLAPERAAERLPRKPGETGVIDSFAASDVYALGVLFQDVLKERPGLGAAFGGGSQALLSRMVALEPGQRPALAEVLRLLRDLTRRPQSPLLQRLGQLVDRSAAQVTTKRIIAFPTVPSDHRSDITERRETDIGAFPDSVAPPVDPLIGKVLDNFELKRCLGRGGMGSVYEATHILIGHRAAVKVLHGDNGRDPVQGRRLLDEARAVNIARHPGLVSIFDCKQSPDGLLYIVMEYLDGETLATALQRCRRFSESMMLPIAEQMAQALATAHQAGVIHRDLKPTNVMMMPDPLEPSRLRTKIFDFGIAKVAANLPGSGDATTGFAIMGTPRYMAPEQYDFTARVNDKADVFSFGVLLYELLSGDVPFGERTQMAWIGRAPQPLHRLRHGISRPLSRLVAKMLQRSPENRPTMQAVAVELSRLRVRRRRLRLLPVGFIAASLLILSVVIAWWRQRAPDLAALEEEQKVARETASQVLLKFLGKPNPASLRAAAVLALGESRDPRYAAALEPLITDGDGDVAAAAMEALGLLGAETSRELLRNLLREPRLERRLAGALALIHQANAADRQAARNVLSQLHGKPLLAGERQADLKLQVAFSLLTDGDATVSRDIWQTLELSTLRPAQRIRYLEALTERGDERAAQSLNQLASATDGSIEALSAAGSLVYLRLADDSLQRRLADLAQRVGPNQLLAAWLLTRADGISGCSLFTSAVQNSQERDDRRILAAKGLRYCRFEHARPTLRWLTDAHASAPLQLTLADSVLRAIGPEPTHAAAAHWQTINDLLGSARPADRMAAIRSLSILSDDSSLDPLTQALMDKEADVRSTAANALGFRRAQRALSALATALDDANDDVRQEGLRAILKILQQISGSPGTALEATASDRLRQLIERNRGATSPAAHIETIIARLVLLSNGDVRQLPPLREQMKGADEKKRRLIVELADPVGELVRTGLADSQLSVRFFAARRRAEIGGLDAIPVLREMLQQMGEEAVASYFLLVQLGDSPPAPAHLTGFMSGRHPVYTRRDVVRLLADLPRALAAALPVLVRAQRDPAVVVRLEAARTAWTLYRSTGNPQLLDLLHALLSDAEPEVRLRASLLLSTLRPTTAAPGMQAARTMGSPGSLNHKSIHAGDGPISDAAPHKAPPSLDAGNSPEAGEPKAGPATAPAATSATSRAAGIWHPPPSPKSAPLDPKAEIDRLLHQAQDARANRNPALAAQALAQARKRLLTGAPAALRDRIDFEDGEIKAQNGNLREALDRWNDVWARQSPDRTAAPVPSIEQKLAELRLRVGRLILRSQQGTRCIVSHDGLYLHGAEPRLTISGVPQTFRIVAGKTHSVGSCK